MRVDADKENLHIVPGTKSPVKSNMGSSGFCSGFCSGSSGRESWGQLSTDPRSVSGTAGLDTAAVTVSSMLQKNTVEKQSIYLLS